MRGEVGGPICSLVTKRVSRLQPDGQTPPSCRNYLTTVIHQYQDTFPSFYHRTKDSEDLDDSEAV